MPNQAESEAARIRFYDRTVSAPPKVSKFFAGIERHFAARHGTHVYFTGTNAADMRLRLGDGTEKATPKSSVFAALEWKPRKKVVYGRCKLNVSDLSALGFRERSSPVSADQPQLSQVWMSEPYWSAGPAEFIELLEAAEKKLIALNADDTISFTNH